MTEAEDHLKGVLQWGNEDSSTGEANEAGTEDDELTMRRTGRKIVTNGSQWGTRA